jgi:pilus assembly protein CpaE
LAKAIASLPVVAVARSAAAVVEEAPVPEVHEGKVITVFGAKGGIGKSTISTNLATLIAQNDSSVLLIDMDTRFGDIAIMMDVEPESTVADLAGRMDEMDEATYREALLLHETGVYILSAPKHPSEWRNITADQMKELIQYGASLFDYVVLDTPGTFNDLVATAIEVAHQVMVISSLDLASIKDTAYMLDLLEAEGYPSERLLLTINDVNAVNTIRVDDLPQIVHHDIYWQIPYDDQVIRAGQSGQPVVVVKPKSRASKEMRALAEKIVGAPAKPEHASRPRRGRRILQWFLRPVPGLRAASIS